MSPAASPARRKSPPKALQALHHYGHRWLPHTYLAVGAVLAFLIVLLGDEGSKCTTMPAQLPDVPLFTVGVVAFGLGRSFSHFAEVKKFDPASAKRTEEITHKALMVVYAVFSLAWLFEAFATAGSSLMGTFQTEAISFYVRCAIYFDKVGPSHGVLSAFVIALICFGAGHWLWSSHPTDPPASPHRAAGGSA